MKKKVIVGLVLSVLVLFSLAILPSSCDFIKPQVHFRLAVPKTEFYTNMSNELKLFLEKKGYQITLVHAESAVDANRLVSDGTADLSFINNHSITIALGLGENASRLRTVMPLTSRLLYVFTKSPLSDSAIARDVFENKRVGVELVNGETHLTLKRFMSAAKINGVTYTSFDDTPEVIVFWGPYYDKRANDWSQRGWHPYSFNANWTEFITLIDPAFTPFVLPSLPGDRSSIRIRTVSTDVILVANRNVEENACYLLAQAIFQNRMDLIHMDVMYKDISESFNKETLLFPLHDGTFSYLKRDQPTFFERYADSIALGISLLALFYGGVQAIQSQLRRRKKERIDKYFLEFLAIRSSKTATREDRVNKLDDLFQRAVVQLTNEKLEKSDFHILSRLLQQDLTMLRFDSELQTNT